MAVTEFTVAPSGAGKSYRRCAVFLSTEYLPQKTGKIWTNFPIHVDQMVSYVVEHNPKMVAQDVADRIRLIPEAELKRWRSEESGPWEFFENISLDGDRIAIDEIHNFCPKEASRDCTRKWKEFLGEMRHRGVEFECLSQNEAKVHAIIKNEAGLKRTLFNCEDRRDPFFSIRMEDWYNLRAKFFTGSYTSTVFETEYLPLNGKWKENHNYKFSFKPEFYALYDSYSTPVAGGVKAAGKIYPFQEHGRAGLLLWFFKRNWLHVTPRFVILCLVFWVCFLGGGSVVINQFLEFQKRIMVAQGTPPASVKKSENRQARTASETNVIVSQSDEVIKLQQELDKVSVEKKKVEDELAKLKQENEKNYQISVISSDYVILKDGSRLDVGEKINGGLYDGLTLQEINLRKRYARFSSGVVVHLSR